MNNTGGPLALEMYAIGIPPLIQSLSDQTQFAKQT